MQGSTIGFIDACHNVEERGFARTIWANNRVNGAWLLLVGYIVNCRQSTKLFRDVFNFQEHTYTSPVRSELAASDGFSNGSGSSSGFPPVKSGGRSPPRFGF